jgi:RNA polymerase sigma-70 factor (ECF subfamily)
LQFRAVTRKKTQVALAQQFLPFCGAARERLGDAPELEATLARQLEAAHAAWPEVKLADAAFLRHLAERLPANRDPLHALAGTHAADLYLACGCALGDPQALRAFDDHFLAQLTGYLRRWNAPPTFTDEVKQALRANLLVGNGGAAPKIASYVGQGPLLAWLRIVATRLAGRMRRTQKDLPVFNEDSPLQLRAPAADPELAYLKTRHRAELEEAFRTTLAALSTRERTILRFHFLDGMNAEAIAAVYKVSKRTAERWLAQTRERILTETRRLLADKLKMEPSQLDTLLGLVQSEIEVSIRSVLGDPPSQ